MIDKLYSLKNVQIDRKLIEKGQLMQEINNLEAQILITQTKITTTSVQPQGAIADFLILQMHKNSMKIHKTKLEARKKNLQSRYEVVVKELIELQKESEQFNYILEEEKKEKKKKILASEEEAVSEFMQSKYIMR